MTKGTHSPHTYDYDPSGLEWRRALLSPPTAGRSVDVSVLLGMIATLILLAGILRVCGVA